VIVQNSHWQDGYRLRYCSLCPANKSNVSTYIAYMHAQCFKLSISIIMELRIIDMVTKNNVIITSYMHTTSYS
jgi:hypothetical protein